MGQHGEPLVVAGLSADASVRVVDAAGTLVARFERNPCHADRAVACVNAMADVPNPEAVERLVDHARAFGLAMFFAAGESGHDDWLDLARGFDDALKAMGALGKRPT